MSPLTGAAGRRARRLLGPPGHGKTTFYRERFGSTPVLVGKDLRPNARKREQRQRRLIEAHLREGRSVVVDNTNPTPVERVPLVAIAQSLGAHTASYAFVASVEDALCRNAARQGRARVPDAGVYAVAKKLALPGADEGFDARFEVRLSETGYIVTAAA